MVPDDWTAVERLERDSHPAPWPHETLRTWARHPDGFGRVAYASGDRLQILGFLFGVAHGDHVYLANLAVASGARRRGVATFLLGVLDGEARERRVERIELDVRESNLAAQLLYRKSGYRAVEIVRGLYGEEDGYRMCRRIEREAPAAAP